MQGRRVLVGLLVVLGVAIGGGILLPALACHQSPPKLDDFGTVPKLALVDERGQAFTEAALRGHPTVVSFIFTRCDTICPVTSLRMQRVQEQTFGTGVKLLSVSVDPKFDTPAILAAYAKRYDADGDRWRFVTGDTAAVRAIVERAFMGSMDRDGETPSGAPNIAHTGKFALVDGDLKIRGFYESSDVTALEEMIRAARYLERTQK